LFSFLPKLTKLTAALILLAFSGRLLVSLGSFGARLVSFDAKVPCLQMKDIAPLTSNRPPYRVRATSPVAGDQVTLLGQALP
jgi:hypothetical protein